MHCPIPLRTVTHGDRVGPYEILDVIAEGAMGRVCRARGPSASPLRHEGRTVALKILRPDAGEGSEVVARFLRETEIAGQLDHPHVATLLDAGEDSGRFYIAMEYAEGESLSRRLEREGQLPIALALDLLLPVCAALDHVHSAGIVHRDVKPDNVLLAWSSFGSVRPMLLDFGVSKCLRGALAPITRASLTLGTPQFMAPEQTRGARFIDHRSDQYSFGAMLYLALTDRLAHEGSDLYTLMQTISQGRVESPRAHRPDLPTRLEYVLLRALCRDAAGRYPSMAELGLALLPFASISARAKWAPVFRGERVCTEPVEVTVPWSLDSDAPDVTLVERYDTISLSRSHNSPWDPDLPVLVPKRPDVPIAIAPVLTDATELPALAVSSGVRDRLDPTAWTASATDSLPGLPGCPPSDHGRLGAVFTSALFVVALLLLVLLR